MIKKLAKEGPARLKVYTKENWGAPFIVGFMLILPAAAVSLSIGMAEVANELSIVAYYAFVVGVVSQLVCFLKYRKKDGELD